MNKNQIEKRLKKFFEANAERYFLEIVLIYGSFAAGSTRYESDIDIALVFSDKLSSDDLIFEIITEISVILTKELSTEVNIIPIYPDFRHPMLYYNAIVLGRPVYVKHFNKYVSLRNEAIFQMEDFQLFGIPWQLEVARKNLESLKYG